MQFSFMMDLPSKDITIPTSMTDFYNTGGNLTTIELQRSLRHKLKERREEGSMIRALVTYSTSAKQSQIP